ncbi:amidohydrolase [Aurantimonas sp. C2-5-R2]|uniref:amidohydrolase n=1 Tax=unclassified Aurantimonas TaxID=2638230 RepID=UPI002E18A510|nr:MULTISPECIES: amidohydrolase [unclassified Aurantimonas]MEC5293130.1 amidohydrolase [Aurantimonas sp. C2-3-R2]MEC5414202.1 amidohydrolase [Aurantimonas sp. C2-4-R8]
MINGNVITVDREDRIASAVAIDGGRISMVGDDNAVVEACPGPHRVIDLKGRTVIPGLIDGHAHLDREGLKTVYPSLAGAACIQDILEIVRKVAQTTPPGEWILTMPVGDPPSYWNVPSNLRENRFPTRWELDSVAPDHPVYIRPAWGYWNHKLPVVSVANSYALRLAGLDRDSAPATSSIEYDRDASTDELTGIFRDWNFMPVLELSVFKMMPRFTHEHRVQGLRDSMRAYNAVGTTGIFEEHGVAAELYDAYRELHDRQEMTVRARLAFSPSWSDTGSQGNSWLLENWGSWLSGSGIGDDDLRMLGFFVSPDVTVENMLRSQAAPYTGWAGFNYNTALPREQLKDLLITAARLGIRPGGLSLELLDVFEEVHQVIPIDRQRWVIGHISIITRRDIERIKKLGLVLTTHTNRHIRREGHLHQSKKGIDPAHDIVPMRSLINAGIHVSLATDNVPISLFHPMWHCVSRLDQYTDEEIAPGQRISRYEALRAATLEGAYLTFDENSRGSIEVGKQADLAVLSHDPLRVPAEELVDITADITLVGGKIVHNIEEES